ncbi:AAA-ATPase At2g46620-like [Andrographis paniculata]|uniref:AAA-ATPase At2g46620-like n=1 Tax=Andrographis paniculata TaxID=175694 RepID=UPI0021E98883|nr:AAA-ATPase At2g46620-like [Andrographis paniculata]
MFLLNLILLVFAIILVWLISRFLYRTGLIYSLKKAWLFMADKFYVYQFYKIPKFNENMQENLLYRKVHAYLNSLPCVEDSDFVNLFSSSKSAEISLIFDENQTVVDKFLGARVLWRFENSEAKYLVLEIRKSDKRRILVPYLQHIHQVFDEIEQKRKEVRLFVNGEVESESQRNRRCWRLAPFTHPTTMETIAMDSDLKARIKSDLENFLKSRQYYHRLGRVWKRSYLLYGPTGTGKSTFIAAMAKFLNYDIYEINLHKIGNDSDLKHLLLQTTAKSLLVVEDLDLYLQTTTAAAVSLSGILNFMDGISSCCGEERVTVFTMTAKENIDPTILRPGRVDVHINFPLCDFTAFKTLAGSHLGLKGHKLFPQVQEIFQTGATLSQAEICEILISNRSSPTRALKTVITALQTDLSSRVGRIPNRPTSGRVESDPTPLFSREGQCGGIGIHPIREIKNLYGFFRSSSRKASMEKVDIDDFSES